MPTKTRRRERLCESRHVRFVEGLYQARIPLNDFWGAISAGLYRTEAQAAAASKCVLRNLPADHTVDPITFWRAIRKGMAEGVVRPTVLPKYVVKRDGKYYARMTKGMDSLAGPFRSAAAACLAAMDRRIQDFNNARSASNACAS